MASLDAIRLLHHLRFHGPFNGGSWAQQTQEVERYEALSPAEKAELAAPAQALREQYEREKGERDLPQVFLEIACLSAASSLDPTGLQLSQAQIDEWRRSLETHWLEGTLGILHQYEGLPLAQRTLLARFAAGLGIDLPLECGDQGERVLVALARIGLLDPSGTLQDIYRGLSAEEGQQLARDTIAIWRANRDAEDDEEEEEDEEVGEALFFLACLVPGSLRGSHMKVFEGDIADAAELFWNLDAEARDAMIRIVETDADIRYATRRLLAWTRDDVVQAVLQRWRLAPPDGDDRFAEETNSAMQDAGWELTETGERRIFYPTECYRLVPATETPAAEVPGPVDVATPHEESCPWCGHQLLNLFDIDLQDPRVAFLAPGWSRLRILMCGRCTGFSHMYSEVNPQGACRWSDLNVHPGFIGSEDQRYDFPPRRLVLGPPRRTPLETRIRAPYMDFGTSQIGGFPLWIQSLEPPSCAKCQQTMSFVGQLSTADADAGSEGMTYAFLCQECRLAVTFYEQT